MAHAHLLINVSATAVSLARAWRETNEKRRSCLSLSALAAQHGAPHPSRLGAWLARAGAIPHMEELVRRELLAQTVKLTYTPPRGPDRASLLIEVW